MSVLSAVGWKLNKTCYMSIICLLSTPQDTCHGDLLDLILRAGDGVGSPTLFASCWRFKTKSIDSLASWQSSATTPNEPKTSKLIVEPFRRWKVVVMTTDNVMIAMPLEVGEMRCSWWIESLTRTKDPSTDIFHGRFPLFCCSRNNRQRSEAWINIFPYTLPHRTFSSH